VTDLIFSELSDTVVHAFPNLVYMLERQQWTHQCANDIVAYTTI